MQKRRVQRSRAIAAEAEVNVPVVDKNDGTYVLQVTLVAPCDPKLCIVIPSDKDKGELAIDWEDEIVTGTLIARDGKLVHKALTEDPK